MSHAATYSTRIAWAFLAAGGVHVGAATLLGALGVNGTHHESARVKPEPVAFETVSIGDHHEDSAPVQHRAAFPSARTPSQPRMGAPSASGAKTPAAPANPASDAAAPLLMGRVYGATTSVEGAGGGGGSSAGLPGSSGQLGGSGGGGRGNQTTGNGAKVNLGASAHVHCDEDQVHGLFPEEARHAGIAEARVRFRVRITSSGDIASPLALENPGYGFVTAALRAIKTVCYGIPARDAEGHPMDAVKEFTFHFVQD